MLVLLPFALLLGCQHKATEPELTCHIEPPEDTPIHAEGTALLDGHGRRVMLRGVNAGGRSKFAPYMPFDFEDDGFEGDGFDAALDTYLDRAAGWGLTALRVPFTWAALEPTQGADDLEWLARYDALLDGAAARGLWTIVDFHQDLYAEALCGDGFPTWTLEDPGPSRHDCGDWFTGYLGDEEVEAAFDDLWSDARGARTGMSEMWARMAAHQADRPGVIGFEVLNEPFAGSADPEIWAPDVLAPLYSTSIIDIQSISPDALIFFDASGLDATFATTDLVRPEGENIVFAPHYYDAAVFLGLEADPEHVDASLARWAALGEDWQVPVLLGELGVAADAPGAQSYADALVASLDGMQLGATWWEYSESAELWNEEDFSLLGPDGEEREVLIAAVARPSPRAIAESDPGSTTWSWDADSSTFTLDFDAIADGITEVTLPTWLYGGHARVTAEGGCIDQRPDRVYLKANGGPARLVVGVAE